MKIYLNVIVTTEPPWYVAKCPDNSVCSQGKTIEEALDNLVEALELYFADASPDDLLGPLLPVFMTTVEVSLS
ncbi:MAG: type II toxin-antitoxin system HicB family antitoxin [Deltaproteobacteria bacterium]|jgi:predicted RNase H-like HicB family nuclease|nr:type II toxin-antitoxin system HicB family antitoxin [Deltaproteobacteria bacterium]